MASTQISEQVYGYPAPSSVSTIGGMQTMGLTTSGGTAAGSQLAKGFLEFPKPAAQALLVVGKIAATRFWTPPGPGYSSAGSSLDPVVTALRNHGLRFESFSSCGGVYARFDLDTEAFDGEITFDGTTNVDMNPNFRSALGRVGSTDPLQLEVGQDHLTATTLHGQVVEKRVPLPKRWIRGFAEVGFATAGFEPKFSLSPPQTHQFIESLPRTPTNSATWVLPTRTGARLSSRTTSAALLTGGPERLRILQGIVPFIESLTTFGPETKIEGSSEAGPTVWVANFAGGRLSLAISPSLRRGFSGEGALLRLLANTDGTGPHEVLEQLSDAAGGRLGYDCTTASWFRRELPFSRSALDSSGSRLAGAQKLRSSGSLTLDADRSRSIVGSGKNEYTVRLVSGEWRCTCPWWAKHRGDRGPCKHVLAVVLELGSRASIT